MTEFDNKYHLSQLTDYTLGETCIGKWIDGREIWRKVLVWPEMAFHESHGILNIKDIIKVSCITKVLNKQAGHVLFPRATADKTHVLVDIDYVEYHFKNTIILEYTVE